MKRILFFILALIFCKNLIAQSNREIKAYGVELQQIQDAVWGYAGAEFKETKIPDNLGKESAVILARSINLSRVSNGKIKFVKEIGIKTHPSKFSIFHERVKINDKAALENFATIEYQKKLDKSYRYGFSKNHDIQNMFIGAKVIKPDGKEILVNTSEEVLVKNETKDRESKLAISELEVGDILDYFICKEVIVDKEIGNLYADNDNLFMLIDEYPLLNLSLDFQFSKKIKLKTIYANGAQHFTERQNDDGDQILSLRLKNIAKYQSRIWTSGFRQYPYIEVGSAYDDELDAVIKKNSFDGPTVMLQAQKFTFEKFFSDVSAKDQKLNDDIKDYIKKNKIITNEPIETAMKEVYDRLRYDSFCKLSESTFDPDFPELSGNRLNSKYMVINLSKLLAYFKVNFDVILFSSRNSNSLDDVFNMGDFEAMIRINADKPLYMAFDDIYTQFNEIPERFQGEKIIVLHPDSRSGSDFKFTESQEVLPAVSCDLNNITENIKVKLEDPGLQKLKIQRIVEQTGTMRHDDQKTLLSLDIVDGELTSLANGLEPEKRFKDLYEHKKLVAALNSAFETQKNERVKNFTAEIKEKFGQEPLQVANCKIEAPGLDKLKPVFKYSEDFVFDNMVKKAGGNLIIDIGKLTGGFYTLEEKERNRNVDVYMACSRSFNYTIEITVPQGFDAKGLEELKLSKSNKTGSFTSSATYAGNILTLSISRKYTNNFEKVTDWPALVEMIDFAANFNSKKILFEKKG